jgi:hypothetical protein
MILIEQLKNLFAQLRKDGVNVTVQRKGLDLQTFKPRFFIKPKGEALIIRQVQLNEGEYALALDVRTWQLVLIPCRTAQGFDKAKKTFRPDAETIAKAKWPYSLVQYNRRAIVACQGLVQH